MPPKDLRTRQRISIDIHEPFHDAMRKIARMHRIQLGRLYDEALRAFLARPENYLGAEQQPTIERKLEQHGS